MPRQNLTANACTVCRKKRTKCDGRQPCRRCVSRGEDCVYEDKMWRTKDHLRSEIDRLRKEVQQCQGLIKALTIGGTAEEWRTIQSRMHRGEPPERIVAWIASSRSPATLDPNDIKPEHQEQQTVSPASSHPSFSSPESSSLPETRRQRYSKGSLDDATSLRSSPNGTHVTAAPGVVSPTMSGLSIYSIGRTASYPLSSFAHGSPMTPKSPRSWKGAATDDMDLTRRLVNHYFDHCFPDFSFICKERFMGDLNKGTGKYCSAALLNAILGLASQSYDAPIDSGPESCSSSCFLAQASELLGTDTAPLGITDIQATGILALAEANVGNDEAAFQLATDCVRKAVLLKTKMDSAGVQTDDPVQLESLASTFCGAFSLIRIFRILTGRLSCQTGPLFMRLTSNDDDIAADSPAARVERGVALQQHFFSQLDRCPELLRFINCVTEVAHTICSYHHDDGVAPADLVPTYAKCLEAWGRFNNWLPTCSKPGKDVIFAQIWYNYILTVLFSTLPDSLVDLRDGITPKAVVTRASETIIFLTGVYQEQCELLTVHPLLPHMVFAAALVQLRRPSCSAYEQQQHLPSETGKKRRKLSEPQSPVDGALDTLWDAAPQESPAPRRPSDASDAAELVYPPWKQHVAPTTMRQADVTDGTDDDDSSAASAASSRLAARPAGELAAEGILHLTKMGMVNRKAAELAKALRAGAGSRSSATAAPEAMLPVPGCPGFQWAPGWETVGWGTAGAGAGIGAGFCGLGVDSLQEFAAVTGGLGSVVPQATTGYLVGNGVEAGVAGDQGLPRCVGDGYGGGSYDGLYIYDNTVPQVGFGGGYGAYAPAAMDGVGVGAFAGGLSSQEDGVVDLA